MDTGQKTESLAQLVEDIDKGSVVLPEFQRDFVWEIDKTIDLFDSFVRDIFVGSLIYGIPSFEITARELDVRPRVGKGSRKKLLLRNYGKQDIERMVKTTGFRLLLDGQQRATSILRAVKGIDPIYFVVSPDEALPATVLRIPQGERSLEQVLGEFRTDPIPGRVCISLAHAYRVLRGEARREIEKLPFFRETCQINFANDEVARESPEFDVYLTQLNNLEVLLRQEKLIAYYLLDTDEEKFALFFERSNSKGLQLNFIDILAAKLYAGFNLRKHIEDFSDANPQLPLNREVLVRAISYAVSEGRDTGRGFILSNLTYDHFNAHWDTFTSLYRRAYDFWHVNRLLIHPSWLPYENMLIPMIAFLQHVPHHDFAQISAMQAKILRTWYWLAILSRRYSSAAQTYVLEDAKALEEVARGNYSLVLSLLQKLHSSVTSVEDLYSVYKKYDAVYKGILNFINYTTGGLVALQSGENVSWESNLEDHHIFPKDYLLKRMKDQEIDSDVIIECVVNRTLIPKLTNIKASNKTPSQYMKEIARNNPNMTQALARHLIPEGVLNGEYDDLYLIFLEDRGKQILASIEKNVFSVRDEIVAELRAA